MIILLVQSSGLDSGLNSSNLSRRPMILLHRTSREGDEILERAQRFRPILVFFSEEARAAAEFVADPWLVQERCTT